MNIRLLTLAITVIGGSLLHSNPTTGQLIPPTKKAARVQITEGPALELAKDTWVIITWTSNNPGGSDEHFGVVHYGRNSTDLSQTAKSHIRLNQNHAHTVFRVRVDGLQPHTTYYYKVDSMDARGISDGVISPVNAFTTP
jgi:phosphodiesterase/alkaline phosphatase D-like protein